MPITIYPGTLKKRNANGTYSDLVPAVGTDPEILDDIATEYVPATTYNTGKYCIHNNDFYRCKEDNVTGTWDSSKWERTNAGDELEGLKITLTQLKTDTFGNINLTGTNNTGSTITAGTFFYNNGALVRAKVDIQNGSAITIGTNAETVTAGGLNELKNSIDDLSSSLDSQTISANDFMTLDNTVADSYSDFKASISGKVVTFRVVFKKTSGSFSPTVFIPATIKSPYRPKTEIEGTTNSGGVDIPTNGKIWCYPKGQTLTSFTASLTYVTE